MPIDLIFPIIHGKGAENGELQGYFETIGFKKYIGNNLISSAATFDKIFTKKIAKDAGVNVVPYIDYYVNPCSYDEAVKMADKMVSIRPDLRSYARVSYLREIHGDVGGTPRAMTQPCADGARGVG